MESTPIDISPDEANLRVFDVVVDISTTSATGPLTVGAVRTTLDALLGDPTRFLAHTNSALIVCNRGVTSSLAATALRKRGFEQVMSLTGGVIGLSEDREVDERYDRQVRLGGFGVEGQHRLAGATITVVGAGGLGCPALLTLVPAGVGFIRIVDFDRIDRSNLHRQPLYHESDVGRSKVDVAVERLLPLNRDVAVVGLDERVEATNAIDLLGGSDVVIDATDTFEARAAITVACFELGIPMIYGSIFGFEGQFAVFGRNGRPCYRCVFPDEPEPGTTLDCATVGTLGSVTAVIGSLQATAAIELAAGLDVDLYGTLTMFDARSATFQRLPVGGDPSCPVCGGLA